MDLLRKNEQVNLGPRLQGLAGLIQRTVSQYQPGTVALTGHKNGVVLADIGSDHAYLPVFLLQHNLIKHALATDAHEGPFQNILRTIAFTNLNECIEARKGDGLAVLNPGEADVLVMAGMGGGTIVKIIRDGASVAGQARCLILQPQNGFESLCRFLQSTGWILSDEGLAEEGGEIYRLMSWLREEDMDWQAKNAIDTQVQTVTSHMRTIKNQAQFDRQFAKVGPLNIARHDKLLQPLIRTEIARLTRVGAGLVLSNRTEAEAKKQEVAVEIQIWEGLLKWLFP